MFGASTEAPEQRPSSPLNSKKMTPLMRETWSVGSTTSAKSECGATGFGAALGLAHAGGCASASASLAPGPDTSTGTALRIRAGVQKRLALAAVQAPTPNP